MKTWKTWTAKERLRLAQLRAAGLLVPEIAQRLRRTHASVRCQLTKDGLRRPLPARQRWLDAFARPHTIGELAKRFGVTRGAVRHAKRRLRRLGYLVPAALWPMPAYPDTTTLGRCRHGVTADCCPACEREQRARMERGRS